VEGNTVIRLSNPRPHDPGRGRVSASPPDIELTRVAPENRKLLDRFIRVPEFINRVYHPNPHWVPSLLMERRGYLNVRKNPFFHHADCAFWIARSGGRDVGRIAAVHDLDWYRFYGEHTGYFGMFDSTRDPVVARALLDAATEWLRRRDLRTILGPFDLSTNYAAGTLVEGFDSDPVIHMPYNPPYYDDLLASYGLQKKKDLWQWHFDNSTPFPEKVVRIANKVRDRGHVAVRAMNPRNWDAEVDRIMEVYNNSWANNWGFVPLNAKEFHHAAASLRLVVCPELSLVAEVNAKPVAVAITILNINPILKRINGRLLPFGAFRLVWDLKIRSTVDTGRLMLLGIKDGYRRQGIDSLLFVEAYRTAIALGWKGGEIGWTLEDNDLINQPIEAMGGKRVKTYRVYGMDL
jgi:GNAT superfamily N-acetyltransferase